MLKAMSVSFLLHSLGSGRLLLSRPDEKTDDPCHDHQTGGRPQQIDGQIIRISVTISNIGFRDHYPAVDGVGVGGGIIKSIGVGVGFGVGVGSFLPLCFSTE